jgi:hypothetical protein
MTEDLFAQNLLNVKQTLQNIFDNVTSGDYEFRGGEAQFKNWNKRRLEASDMPKAVKLLQEADIWMIPAIVAPVSPKVLPKKKKGFWD